MNLHGSLGIQVDAQVAYPAGSLDKIVADACGFLWDMMLPTARRTPQHLSLRGVELESIAAHPRCDVVHTRRHLLSKNGCSRRMTCTIHQYRQHKGVNGGRNPEWAEQGQLCTAETGSVRGTPHRITVGTDLNAPQQTKCVRPSTYDVNHVWPIAAHGYEGWTFSTKIQQCIKSFKMTLIEKAFKEGS